MNNLTPILVKLGQVMGSVSVMEASFPNDVKMRDPDYRRACQSISEDLREVFGQLTDIQDGAA